MSCFAEAMQALRDVCEDCPHSTGDGPALGCRFLAVGSIGHGRDLPPKPCALGARMRSGKPCPDPAGDRWAGIERPEIPPPPSPALRKARTEYERKLRICLGHSSGREDALPRCASCNSMGRCVPSDKPAAFVVARIGVCPEGKW